MKRRVSAIYWILICHVLLASCTGTNRNSPIDIEESYVNQQILLSAPEFFNTYKTIDAIYLELTSNSNNEIVFPNNYNLRIFENKNGGWIEIFEIPTTRLPEGDVIFSPNKKLRETTFVDLALDDHTRNYQLRIYVIGAMKTNNEVKQVAAYLDIELHP